jgi:ATP diphosphatase
VAKIREEIDELERELDGMDPVRLGDEVGDLLFAAVNLARHLQVDPEEALRRANRRFEQRFNYVESSVSANGESIEKVGTDALEALWIKAKSSGL